MPDTDQAPCGHEPASQEPPCWLPVVGSATDQALEQRPPGADPELIVLVDTNGRPIGSAEKAASHHGETPLHLAFSCYLFDQQGRFLVTQRAHTKQVWPGAWSNSLCGHPAPGETLEQAITRRLSFELGMTAQPAQVVLAHHLYRAPAYRGIVEYEFCPVYAARASSEPQPNAAEVAGYAWVAWESFVSAALADPGDAYSWWCKNQLRQLRHHPVIQAYCRPSPPEALLP